MVRGTGPALRGPALFVRPRRLLAGFAALVLGLAACAGEPDLLTLDQDDSGTDVRLAVGEEMEVRLRSNASTGYSWQLAGDDLDEDVLQVISSEYEPDEGSEDLAGAGGTEIWRFRARGPGSVPVALEYTFGGDETREPAGEFSVVVTVE
ncbi:MAG: protease inhibitor I42 family protein [Actinomycetota bacterium]|nr:protease inhibitor I42 family protein [Actinomycetota bacterium]